MSTLRDVSRDRASLRREVERFPGLLKDAIKRAAKQVRVLQFRLWLYVLFHFGMGTWCERAIRPRNANSIEQENER